MPLALATWPPARLHPNTKLDPRTLRPTPGRPAAEAAAGGGVGWVKLFTPLERQTAQLVDRRVAAAVGERRRQR